MSCGFVTCFSFFLLSWGLSSFLTLVSIGAQWGWRWSLHFLSQSCPFPLGLLLAAIWLSWAHIPEWWVSICIHRYKFRHLEDTKIYLAVVFWAEETHGSWGDEGLQERGCLYWSQTQLSLPSPSQLYKCGSLVVFVSSPFRWSTWHVHLLLSSK